MPSLWWSNLLNKILGEACPECGKRHMEHYYAWTRGWNELCSQASGEPGTRCYDCGHIVWDTPYDEYVARLPDWVRPYPDRIGITNG